MSDMAKIERPEEEVKLYLVAKENEELKAKLAAAERERRGLAFHIEVDGGVGLGNAASCFESGVNVLVAGTSLYGLEDMAAGVRALRGTPGSRVQGRAGARGEALLPELRLAGFQAALRAMHCRGRARRSAGPSLSLSG